MREKMKIRVNGIEKTVDAMSRPLITWDSKLLAEKLEPIVPPNYIEITSFDSDMPEFMVGLDG